MRHLIILQYSLGIRYLFVIIVVGVSVTLFCVALERMRVSSLTLSPSTLTTLPRACDIIIFVRRASIIRARGTCKTWTVV